MKHRAVVWRPRARADLLALYDWIAERADPDTAFAYTSGIEAHANRLATFPERGTPRAAGEAAEQASLSRQVEMQLPSVVYAANA